MVIHLFRYQGSPRHKAEGLVEVLEDEFLADGITAAGVGPTGELGQCRFAGFCVQFLRHDTHLLTCTRTIAADLTPWRVCASRNGSAELLTINRQPRFQRGIHVLVFE